MFSSSERGGGGERGARDIYEEGMNKPMLKKLEVEVSFIGVCREENVSARNGCMRRKLIVIVAEGRIRQQNTGK